MSDRGIGILILIALAIAGAWFFFALRDVAEGTPSVTVAPVDAAEEPVRTRVRVKLDRCDREGRRTVMQGTVINTGNVPLTYVSVTSLWKNPDGLVLHRDELYVVNGESLAPGESRSFTDVSEYPGVSRCNAEALDWW